MARTNGSYTDHLAAVSGRLATIEEHVRNIDGHLGRLNGQITRHGEELDAHSTQLAVIETRLHSATKWRDRLGGAAATGVLSLGLFVLEKLF